MSDDDLPYEYEIHQAASFDSLLRQPSASGNGLSLDEVISLGYSRGRILIQAPGGSGKTRTLGRLVERLEGLGRQVLQVDVLRIATSGSASDILDSTLANLLASIAPNVELDHLLEAEDLWLLVDGVNEVGPMGNPLLRALDRLAAAVPTLKVVAADRLNRRPLDVRVEPGTPVIGAWGLLTLSEIPDRVIKRLLGGRDVPAPLAPALRNPYLLSLFRREFSAPATSTSALVDAWLTSSGGLPKARQRAAAALAFRQYAENKSRLLAAPDVLEAFGPATVKSMASAGTLIPVDEGWIFNHQLVSDYLAARHLATSGALWTHDNFDALTLRASSFDPLGLVVEQLDDQEIEEFTAAVYNWNFYGSVYVIDRAEAAHSSLPVSTAFPILAMVAERRWDVFASTASRSADAIGAARSHWGRLVAQASSREDLVDMARDLAANLPTRWLTLFEREEGPATERDVQDLIGADALLGWTASNAVRRSEMGRKTEGQLAEHLISHRDPVVRWRCAHALGTCDSPRSRRALLFALDLPGHRWRWVRYGAFRSLVERAARGQREGEVIFREVVARASSILADSLLVRDVQQALLLRRPPEYWQGVTGALIEELWALETTVEGQDRWRDLASRLARGAEEALYAN